MMSPYESLLRPLLFSFDPEQVHDFVFRLLPLARYKGVRAAIEALYCFEDPRLTIPLFGLTFRNPIGLAAGFDKECAAPHFFDSIGFGHIELGTITALPQAGNERPRIFRLPADGALINRMGFPSKGVEAVAGRLATLRQSGLKGILGVNIGKSKVAPLETAEEDYLASFLRVRDYADYVTINVSSPNTPELRKLQEPARLIKLFETLSRENSRGIPLLVKIAPDLSVDEIRGVIDVVKEAGVSGIIATNTTIGREGLRTVSSESGGLSGKPLFKKSLGVISEIFRRTEGKIPIVGVGGVSSGDDALEMIRHGASLVQIYTGLIYRGPTIASSINRFLVKTLSKRGKTSLLDLCGEAL